ncbi:Endonuclease/exonuclease/phosphatase [Stachybotrys elegans]|uniref:Endonuclease/exonuclease/phosphatase n=1 Tax=Stachybotrys elegans TaxID=80388 RepID=A0A8K0SJV4_9HYPO|nr:Endonuclease/exonuclease/phosphatase [Stachybotrys elegans]
MSVISRLRKYLASLDKKGQLRPCAANTSSESQLLPCQTTPCPPPPYVDWVQQPWHEFQPYSGGNQWTALETKYPSPATEDSSSQDDRPVKNQKLRIVTWNVDAAGIRPRARIAALLAHILSLSPPVDVIFLQEVSKLALGVILENTRVRASWFSTDRDGSRWSGQPFANVTLLSRARFCHNVDMVRRGRKMVLGRVYRIKYKSRYGRDALCCDVHVDSCSCAPQTDDACVRLINVHLDSRAIQPSHRPAQVVTVASALREAGRGVVAGDFNPVLPEDETLVEDNGLVDAWTEKCGSMRGHTWRDTSASGEEGRCASRRMDKVAVTGLDVEAIEVLPPGVISTHPMGWGPCLDERGVVNGGRQSVTPLSDHSGLLCTLSWPGAAS